MQFDFLGQQQSFAFSVIQFPFINKAQFDAGFAHRLILKDGAVPVMKDIGHDSEPRFVGSWRANVCNSLAPSMACLQKLGCFQKEP